MHGFICVIPLKNQVSSIEFTWKKPFDFQGKMTKRRIDNASFQLEQFTSKKFIDEKQWVDNDDFMFVSEGVIVNLSILKKEHNEKNLEKHFLKLYENDKLFFQQLEGSFSGIFFDKRKNIWYAFNNQSHTKRLYYFQHENHLILSTDLFTLANAMRELKYETSLDEQAAYLLLTSRFVLENLTLISGVKQLRAGEYLTFQNGKLTTDFYFHLENIKESQHSKNEIIENLNNKFIQAIKFNHEIDLKYNFNHLTTLSGGLDSRTELIYAYENGFNKQTALNFSQKGYADQIISKKIANSLNIPIFQFTVLPDALKAIDEIISVNDGMITYSGCFHIFSILNQADYGHFGAVHTGIMGDTVMGSYVTNDKNQLRKRLYAIDKKLQIPDDFINNLLSNYQSDELSMIYNTVFIGESNGFQFFDLIGETMSPFLNTDFMSYAFSIPSELKKDSKIYIDWLKKYQPKTTEFTWETLACKPTNNQFLRQFHRYKRAAIKRLPFKTMWKHNHAPAQFWYENNEDVMNYLDAYFYENVDRIDNTKLKSDLLDLYKERSFTVKANCITLVGAVKLLFG